MADWTDIPDANLAPNAPARSADMIAMRDNITAQAEGSAGAPKTQTAAIEDESITVDKMARYTGTTSKEIWRDPGRSVSTTSSANVARFYMCQGGAYTFQWFADSTTDKRSQILVNGAVAYSADDLAGGITRGSNITVSQGDVVILRILNINQPGTATMSDPRVFHEKVVPINGV